MSRVEEVENSIRWAMWNALAGDSTKTDMVKIARALAAEVDELRAKLDQVRSEIGCARDQRTTQFCAEAVEYKRRLDAVCKMLEVPTESSREDGWLAYCEECWWRGEAEDANWGTDPDSDGYCPECGKEILEMDGDWSREQSIHARAVAIAEGRE